MFIYLFIYSSILYLAKVSRLVCFEVIVSSGKQISLHLSLSPSSLVTHRMDAICTFPLLRRDKSLVSTLLDSQRVHRCVYIIYIHMHVRRAIGVDSHFSFEIPRLSSLFFFLFLFYSLVFFFSFSLSLSLFLPFSLVLVLSLSLFLSLSPLLLACSLCSLNFFFLNYSPLYAFRYSPLDRWLKYKKKKKKRKSREKKKIKIKKEQARFVFARPLLL